MAMRKGLGKGLGALIGDYNEQPDAPSEGAVTLPLQKIEPNPLQPRKTFNPEELDSLADSIRMHGIIQPLTVRRLPPAWANPARPLRTRCGFLASVRPFWSWSRTVHCPPVTRGRCCP